MLRSVGLCLGGLLALVPAALAAEVSGALVPCRSEHECRYVMFPALGVTFEAAPGEVNEVSSLYEARAVDSRGGVRVRDMGATIATTGEYCDSLGEHEALCGPRPGELTSGIRLQVRTGDAADVALAEVGTVHLGPGDDTARGSALINGGKGDDDIRARVLRPDVTFFQLGNFHGGPGRDVLVGGRHTDLLDGGPGGDRLVGGAEWFERISGGRGEDRIEGRRGGDRIVGGRGADEILGGAGDDRIAVADGERDVVRCGPGRDRVRIDSRDVARGCERVVLGRRG